MGSSNLTNIYAKDIIDKAVIDESIRKSAVWNSGLVSIDPELNGLVAAGEGRKISRIGYVDIPDPVTTGNAVQSTTHNPAYMDDSDTNIIPNASSVYQYDAVKTGVAHALGQKEIIKSVSFLPDPVTALSGMVERYWARYYDMYATSIFYGMFLENIANGSSDMIVGDGTAAVSGDLIIDALGTLGDAATFGGVMICHSKVALALRKAQLIDSIPDANNPNFFFEYFGRTRMLVSDNTPNHTNATNDTAITILADYGVLDVGNSDTNIIASELFRDPRSGSGAGEEMLITRNELSMHPHGYSWLDNTVTGSVATGNIGGIGGTKLWPCPADMQAAANWERKLDRKKVKVSFLHTSEIVAGI